jgi:chorismate lyase
MRSCGKNLVWKHRKQCLHVRPDSAVTDWIFDPASLTARLIAACKGQFRVEVLSLQCGLPRRDEARALKMSSRQLAQIRQVLLYCNDVPWVYARTIMPVSSLQGALRGLTRLGNKPLGAVLFANRTMRRSVIEVTRLTAQHPCYAALLNPGNETVWGRRSVFHLHDRPLLVSEFFLPAM